MTDSDLRQSRVQWALFGLRLSVFMVMAIWTVDKFVRPQHAAKVYEKFYFIGGLSHQVVSAIGVAELLLLLLFVAGIQKRLTTGIVLVLHTVSTLSSFQQYLDPFTGPNLLFFAAWPMLAAIATLYVLRDEDTLYSR